MAAITGSTYEITQYLSFYTRKQLNSNGKTHIFGVETYPHMVGGGGVGLVVVGVDDWVGRWRRWGGGGGG